MAGGLDGQLDLRRIVSQPELVVLRPGFRRHRRGAKHHITPFIRHPQPAAQITWGGEEHEIASFLDLGIVRILFSQKAVPLQEKAFV